MAKRGSGRDYKFGAKNNWRRAGWNEILRRTEGRERHEPILYLAGPQDLDRQVASQKGVPDQNLIAIDTEQSNIDAVRSGKGPAVRADVLDVLWSWPQRRAVCAVLLDFCSGIESKNVGIYDAFEREPLRNAIVMVNFQRGRDPWSNQLREALAGAELLDSLVGEFDGVESPKHRAYQFLLWHAWDCVATIAGRGSRTANHAGEARFPYVPRGDPDRGGFLTMILGFLRQMQPRFFSYKSGDLTFDSVVFRHHARIVPTGFVLDELVEREKAWREPLVQRRVSAMLAVRTMRGGQ